MNRKFLGNSIILSAQNAPQKLMDFFAITLSGLGLRTHNFQSGPSSHNFTQSTRASRKRLKIAFCWADNKLDSNNKCEGTWIFFLIAYGMGELLRL